MNDELQLPRAARVFVSFAALLRANDFAVAPEQTTAFLAAIELLGPRGLDEIRRAGLATLAPPPERRALVFIDPPYEEQEQELERAGDEAEPNEARIDDAVEAENHLPGEDAQEIARPERDREENDPGRLAAGKIEGYVIGGRIGRDDGNRRHHRRYHDRLDEEPMDDRVAQNLLIVG